MYNRAVAASGYNPNAQVVYQAGITTTTTTTTDNYRTLTAALGKIAEGGTASILTTFTGTIDPVTDELLFNQATFEDKQDNSVKALSDGTYIDVATSEGVNVRSGKVEVTPAAGNYAVYLGAALNAAKSGYDGGIKLESTAGYTLVAEDPDSPIAEAQNGPASITIPTAGQSVTVTYPAVGSTPAETVTYTAKTDNDKFYLGTYTIDTTAVNSNAVWKNPDVHAHHGTDVTLTFEPNTGFELEGGCFRVSVVGTDAAGAPTSSTITLTKDDANSVAGSYTLYTGSGSGTNGSVGKVTVKQFHEAGLTGVPGSNRNGKLEISVENVRSHIKITTEGEAVKTLSPQITIRGKGVDKDGNEVLLYSYAANMTYKDGVQTKPVQALAVENYRLDGVKNGTSDAALTDGALTNTNQYDVNLTHGDQIVEFRYVWNMADVTIKANFNGQPFPGYTNQVVEVKQGVATTINAPNLSGYAPDVSSKEVTPTGNTAEVTFNYTKISTNVIWRAVDEQGNELGTFKGESIQTGEAPNLSHTTAPTFSNYMLKDESNGVPTSAGATDRYDGANDITVTWTYVPRTKAVEVYYVKYNDANPTDTTQGIGHDLKSYEKITTGQTLTITAPEKAGYKVKVEAGNPEYQSTKDIFITNDATTQKVYFYYVVDPDYSSNITVKLEDAVSGTSLGGYKVPGVADQSQVINAPELHGYTVDRQSVTAYTNRVNETSATAGEVIFKYTKNIWTVTVKLMDSSKSPAEDITGKAHADWPRTYEVIKGSAVTITAPNIYGYTLATGETVSKQVTTNDTTSPAEVVFNYVPVDKSLVTIKITDVQVKDGTTTPYLTRTETVAAGTATKEISMLSIPKYKLTGATVGGSAVTVTGSTLTVNTNGANAGETIEVVVTHTYNMVQVTVEAKFNGEVKGSYPLLLEKGVQAQILPPSVPGYTATVTDQSITPDDTTTNVTFTLTKDNGNVTIIIKDKDGGAELYRKDGGTVANGSSISLAIIAGVGDANLPTIEFYQKSATPAVIMVGTNQVTDGTQYDGTNNDITVTYEYERKTQSIAVIKKDVDSDQTIETQTIPGLPVGKKYTFADTVSVPSGYSAANGNPDSCYVEDRLGQTVTFYYKSTNLVSITVKLMEKDGNGVALHKEIQTYSIPNQTVGATVTINDPAPAGYVLATGEAASRNVVVTGTDVVEFLYTIKDPKTVTVKLWDNTAGTEFDSSKYPTNYTTGYTLKQGDSKEIWAPVIDGYTLMSASLNGGAALPNKQMVQVEYNALTDAANTVTFSYFPVTQANFVTHTVNFLDSDGNEFYRYNSLIGKSDATTEYRGSNVSKIVPGYKLEKIVMIPDGETSTEVIVNNNPDVKVDAPNNKNVTIQYWFDEDSAKIIIEKYNGTPDAGGTLIGTNVELTGYRAGLENIVVVAPVVDGYALVSSLTQTIPVLQGGDNVVKFQYAAAGAVTFTLKENKADGSVETIEVINGVSNGTYDPVEAGNPLNLTQYGYIFTPHSSATSPFKNGEANKVENLSLTATANYDVYYTKETVTVEFVAVDQKKLDDANKTLDEVLTGTGLDINDFKASGVTPVTPEAARKGETYKAVAQSFDGWVLADQLSKYYSVNVSDTELKVYFVYREKATGDVTVHYHYGQQSADDAQRGPLLLSYTMSAVVGEKVTVNAPEFILDNKYKLRETAQQEQALPHTLTVTDAGTTVEIYYDANFWTVTENVVQGGGAASTHGTHEVVKTNSVTLYPPNRAGFTLAGIKVESGSSTDGSDTTFPTAGWDSANNKLTLTPGADTAVTYYYTTTTAAEYQSTVTVKYLYNGYDLKDRHTVQVNKANPDPIPVPSFDGYTANTYTFEDGGAAGMATGIGGASITVIPTQNTGTLTITYVRADNSVVLPGQDNEIKAPDKDADNVLVKPDGNTGRIEMVDSPESGSAKVNDPDGATVTRPTDPTNPGSGKDNIKVPDGTVIKPDGTIVLPDGGGTIGPNQTLPTNTPANYITVIYKPNTAQGGMGEELKHLVKSADAKALGNSFTNTAANAQFVAWNTDEQGTGTAYAVGDSISLATGNSITLYAQWNTLIYTNSATLTYKANNGTAEETSVIVGSNDNTSFNATLIANTFSLTGWNFGGWNEQANGSGTLYRAGATFAMSKDVNKTLYAQWYRVNDNGSITVPGQDGDPTTDTDNATANGNGTQAPGRDNTTGDITIPAGGSVTVGDKTIALPDGGTLKPDGTVIINRPDSNNNGNPDDGKIEVKPDGSTEVKNPDNSTDATATVVTLTYQINNGETDEVKVYAVVGDKVKAIANPFTWAEHIFLNWMEQGTPPVTEYAVGDEITAPAGGMTLHAQWAGRNQDGSVELPGKDGILAAPNDADNVLVKPDGSGSVNPVTPPDGSVKVEDPAGGTVTRPDPEDPTRKEDVKVPDGTIVKPDGTIVLPKPAPGGTEIGPDAKLPDALAGNAVYVTVSYLSGTGSGDVIRQIVEKSSRVTAQQNPFTAPAGMVFDVWSAGAATTYQVGDEIPTTADLTLTAQWKSANPWAYTATINFYPNINNYTPTHKTQNIGSVDSSTITAVLEANTFTHTGWTFLGWSTVQNGAANGTFYKDAASVTLNNGDTLSLYAIWYKQDGGNVALPGVDGLPADERDNLTVKPGAGSNPTVKNDNGQGYVEAGTGNQIEKNDPNGTLDVVRGPVQVYPDGTVKVPEGSQVKLPDGTTVDGPATINPDNTVDRDGSDKPRREPNGDITLPGKDGKLDPPKEQDNVTVTPDKDGNNQDNSTIDDATGKVTLPDGGEVKYPSAPNGNGSTVDAPAGSIVWPDGTIEFPNTDEAGSITGPDGNTKPIPGGSSVDKDGVVTYRYTIKFGGVGRADDHVMVKDGTSKTYTAPHFNGYTVNTQSATWTGGSQPFTITFTYTQGTTVNPPAGGGGGGGGGTTTKSYTITASAGNGGTISPSGKISVESGGDKAFTITASNGYRIKSVLVDGRSVGAVGFYVFEKVSGNHSISVTFEAAKPAISMTDPSNTGVGDWLRYTEHTAYMNGYGNGLFGARDNLTRAQTAQLFYNLLVNRDVEITVSFLDVPADAWYLEAVTTLASLGIVNGIGEGWFEPDRTITRAEFTVIATRFAKATGALAVSPFDDVRTDDWFFANIVTAVSYGWIDGYGNGLFGPNDNITRAEAATIVNRMLGRTADREFIGNNGDICYFEDVTVADWFYYQVMEAANGHSHDYSSDGYEIWSSLYL